MLLDFPGGSDSKSVCLQWGRPGFEPWVRKIPWRRKWQPIPVLLPGKSYGRRSLVGYSPWGRQESDTTERLQFHFLLVLHQLHLRSSGIDPRDWGPYFKTTEVLSPWVRNSTLLSPVDISWGGPWVIGPQCALVAENHESSPRGVILALLPLIHKWNKIIFVKAENYTATLC